MEGGGALSRTTCIETPHTFKMFFKNITIFIFFFLLCHYSNLSIIVHRWPSCVHNMRGLASARTTFECTVIMACFLNCFSFTQNLLPHIWYEEEMHQDTSQYCKAKGQYHDTIYRNFVESQNCKTNIDYNINTNLKPPIIIFLTIKILY